MLKAIRKFVLQRSEDIRQRRPQIVEEDDAAANSRSESEVTPQRTEPQLDKRYGFVELSDGSGDAFLHVSALAGISTLQPGETLELRVAPGPRGPQMTESSAWTAALQSRAGRHERALNRDQTHIPWRRGSKRSGEVVQRH
jgi:cold shock CspA family protein